MVKVVVMDRLYLAAFHTLSGIGPARLKALLDYFGSAKKVWQADRLDLISSQVIKCDTVDQLIKMREKIDIAKFAENLQEAAVKICMLGDRNYPQLLSKIYNPPILFYYRGKLSEKRKIAVVGARQATVYGRNTAQYLARELAAADICVVSGACKGD